ncbi:hypothetical protein [Bacillus mycoides]|uniref:hypothetical protein n=1 Tax=Bacillus mycoides TaxID=1405 RepID=UPI00256FFF89|nr:hypothetical protein [Bacillus mycoides]MDM5426717.1 hypothetical protein [Bacillus mycoides]MED1012601.1 hypothetical protein [Bacillus mycoides]MED1052645.1 hypothetical protein [Bacillus mycoides]WJE65595.1 hypothetical protein QRE63_06730 [Bacillus mycoides]
MNKVKIVTHSGGTLDVTLEDGKLQEFKEWLESESSQLFTIEVDKHREINLTNVSVLLFSVTKEGN